jgi:hypothetical protein
MAWFVWSVREKQKHGASSTVTEFTFFLGFAKSQWYRVQNGDLGFIVERTVRLEPIFAT